MPPGFYQPKFAAAKGPSLFNLIQWTIGSKSSNTINVAMQLADARNRAIAQIAESVFLPVG